MTLALLLTIIMSGKLFNIPESNFPPSTKQILKMLISHRIAIKITYGSHLINKYYTNTLAPDIIQMRSEHLLKKFKNKTTKANEVEYVLEKRD